MYAGQIDSRSNPQDKMRHAQANNATPSDPKRPLVTFFLVSYNQSQYVKEAVRAALAQDYSPLEVILSDDASSDDTFAIMTELAKRYVGPHKVVLNRNPERLGVCGHVNKCMAMASGALLVGAAGDDISMPHRVTALVQAWNSAERRSYSLFSNCLIIDEAGEEHGFWFAEPPNVTTTLAQFEETKRAWLVGCSHAFAAELFQEYGDLDVRILQEDGALAFRALLLGEIQYVDEALVKYRRHSKNSFSATDPRKVARLRRQAYFMKRGWLRDARHSQAVSRHLLTVLRSICLKAYVTRVVFSIPFVSTGVLELKRWIGDLIRSRRDGG